MPNRLIVLVFLLLCTTGLWAQEKAPRQRHFLFSVSAAATQLPPGRVFSLPLHPGVNAGVEFRYNHSPLNQFFQTVQAGYWRHRYVQSGVQVYTEVGYRRVIWRGLGTEIRLGGGYLHAIPANEVFRLDGTQYAQQRQWGRPQAMAGAALALSYTLTDGPRAPRIFLEDQFYLQFPFVKQYVPLLPNTVLRLGVALPFSTFQR
jgi:hypothetical protein